jgi:hypothetical protein
MFVGIRRSTTVAALLLCSGVALAAVVDQVKDELFAGAEKFAAHAKESTEVNLDSKLLGLAGKMGDGKTKDLTSKLDFVIVRSYEYAKEGEYKMADVEEFTARLNNGGWSHIVKERSATESTDVCVRTDNEGQVSELVVIDAEPKELTFVHLKGHLNMQDLMKAGQQYGVPQGEPKLKNR